MKPCAPSSRWSSSSPTTWIVSAAAAGPAYSTSCRGASRSPRCVLKYRSGGSWRPLTLRCHQRYAVEANRQGTDLRSPIARSAAAREIFEACHAGITMTVNTMTIARAPRNRVASLLLMPGEQLWRRLSLVL